MPHGQPHRRYQYQGRGFGIANYINSSRKQNYQLSLNPSQDQQKIKYSIKKLNLRKLNGTCSHSQI